MKTLFSGARVRMVVAALAAAALLVTTDLNPILAASQVPFSATYSGSFHFIDQSHFTLAGAGNASYLGQSTNRGSVTVIGTTTCALGTGFVVHDVETLTSTGDGDQIAVAVDDTACPTVASQPLGTGVYHQVGTYTVMGGTKRFADARGQGSFDCFGDFDHFTYTFSLNGTISRPSGG
jgi:hypothetical protein